MTSSTKNVIPNFFVALDDRVDLCAEVLETSGEPSAADREQAANLKRVVFDGITTAVENGLQKSHIGLWADSDLGESVLLRAKAMSMTTASSPGSRAHSLDRLDVDFTAVQLTLNPDGPKDAREELLDRLKIVSDKARDESISLLIELDSVPTTAQTEIHGSTESARAMLLIMAIQQLQDVGVSPAIWAFEPAKDDTLTETIAAKIQIDSSNSNALLVMGGELSVGKIGNNLSETEKRTIRTAARTPGITGVLIGPEAYFRHLVQLNVGLIDRNEAVDVIASYLGDIGGVFEQSFTASEIL
ncbi:MAG: DUF2090 domain-containing protein [Dehalococcoidia bacterium]|jgi:myo-inositol catabolism protein IolC|nr:DUF2090 domain-containing protein [Dehalococcoidia bacterium]